MSNSSFSLRSCSVENAVRGRLSSCAALELSRFFPLRDLGPEVNNNNKVKSGIFGQTAKIGLRPCLFHSSIIEIKK